MPVHDKKEQKIAVILFNLGGPDNLKAVKPFLFNLFYDPAIIALKNPFRWLVAKILAAKKVPTAKEIYKKLGGKSPLLEQTMEQAVALENKLNEDAENSFKCFISMRYWHPFSYETAMDVKKFNPDKIILLPLYPQYSITTTGSSFIDWIKNIQKILPDVPYYAVRDYPEEEGFIEAHFEMIKAAIDQLDHPEEYRILYSAHGLPEKIIEAGDPYCDQIEQTCAAIQKKLGHPDHVICFQSRVGPLKWTEPYTDDEILRAGKDGKSIIIIPIAFVSEHSETLVELDIEYRELAIEAKVKDYIRIGAICCHPLYITALAKLTKNIMI
ncbi:MAG: ferrochelatase [Emcibacter sp.]|nr:ferrochelatase [Emcibacter sp.]